MLNLFSENALGLPFCQSSQEEQTKLSTSLRIAALVLGIITAFVGVLILLSVPGLNYLGTTAGWTTFSIGSFFALVGASIKCIKKSSRYSSEDTIIDQKPLVVPTPVETQEIETEQIKQFLALEKGSTIWMGEERDEITIGTCVGRGGSKQAMEISENEVLMLPNSNNGFYMWRRMVDEEVQVSEKLTELGICTVQSKRVDVYLSKDSDQALPAYICPSFKALAKNGRYVIDKKNHKQSSCWQGKSFFQGDEDRYAIDTWKPILKPLLMDIYTLAKYNCLFYGDSLNLVIIKNEQGYIARYFGFDFSSKAHILECTYGYRQTDVIPEVVRFLPYALEHIFWEQFDSDTGEENFGLPAEYQQLIEEFQKQCPQILGEMLKK